MTTTIIATLAAYGFEARRADFFWGIGSLVWGHTASVKALGADLYEVTIAHWAYDPDGEPMMDTRETRVLHGALALAWVFEEMPSSFWRIR
jgi:hypothetical protein